MADTWNSLISTEILQFSDEFIQANCSEGLKTFFYGAFYWQLKIGVGAMLGSRSDGQFEIIFSSPSFNRVTGADDNYPSTQKINMTTIAFLFSIRFFQMGQ